ncbi:hypothetical protein ONO12_28265, partial [Salmonella enterica subsp. enterica serovar Montevideo]|nr:hypothetical protein [Salmonella enterica subsp. enterica serovar Montevideo]
MFCPLRFPLRFHRCTVPASSSIKFSVLDVATCDVLMAGIADGMNTENAFLSINGDKPINL